MSWLETIVGWGNDILWTYVLIALLLILGVYFSIRTKFVQFRMIREMVMLLGEGATVSKDKKKRGVSSFQAFSISTASRVGTGNLAGVALAISLGGPGAVFWMWIIALIGAATAFVESTLAQIYKVKDDFGFRGGPAYYMEKGLNKRWLGILFSILITFTFGLVFNSVQANTISLAFENSFGLDRVIFGVVLTTIVAIIIFGGIKRIARVAELIVPFMAILYLLIALYVIVTNVTEIPSVIALIVNSAFGLEEAVGGGMGAALMNGIKRGLFSNEAGMGSAPNAAATASVSHPAKQGLIQTLSVFTDTILICSATAFMIILSGVYTGSDDGIQLTQQALTSHLGEWAGILIAIFIFLFAFSSVVGNYYYGESNIEFMGAGKKSWLFVYRLAVVGMVLFGSIAKIAIVWSLADLFMALMALVNLIAITMLGKIAFATLKDYIEQKREGKNPVFDPRKVGLHNTEVWDEERAHYNKATHEQ
ncbi:alanine:cation symporter family protein [Alkalihalobacillus berkeleyi]|uniref:Alanine:cation symporter family protein n=1 Tax=Pseudalkalibacillus berkeleyi TaxID=1069813 RepID=A0ABS9H3B4_9BACL|nr:alanine/glycine:cation symporter family protein [Pseudalkalibacillus berkeleyi]MCF6138450.1 alanine:cation symporter family protein [Pseudalkalibacillus berkeleyi]